VTEAIAAAFRPGDLLLADQTSGELLHVPAATAAIAGAAIGRAVSAFEAMSRVSDLEITQFFEDFAHRLGDDRVWGEVARSNSEDVARAAAAGRTTTRLAVTPQMRADMIAGLRAWGDAPPGRGRVTQRIDHAGWSVEQVTAPLGVVAFVFEGRPNVFADAAGVIRGGNTVVFRIGADALETARAMAAKALAPALEKAGLPDGAAVLVESADRAAGWAMFADPRLALAVARGSGAAVTQLGAIARAAGTPVSLHGTGGAWMVADVSADAARFSAAVGASLDRKVCNTLNVCCIVLSRAAELVPLFLAALLRAGDRRGHNVKLHVAEGDETWLPAEWRSARVRVRRADGDREEALVESLAESDLGREWEWEETPEVTLKVVGSWEAAAELFNRYSPKFSASLIAEEKAAQDGFYERIDAAFVGDGFTRWVDGQYAFDKPELGLSNWQNGRLFARGAVLSGDDVFTIRSRMRQHDPALRR
jgi:glutamate-5-semialdehyde dehydrogenase